MRAFLISELNRVTSQIWEYMFEWMAQTTETAPSNDVDTRSAMVMVSGAWQGAVIITASRNLAGLAAAHMFSVAPEEVSDECVGEALKELANITGGNIKTVLPEPCVLSTPVSLGNVGFGFYPAETEPVCSLHYTVHNEPFKVTVAQLRE